MSTIKLKTIVPDNSGVVFTNNGTVQIQNTTASTGTSSGALVISGGIGINKNTNASSLTSGGSLTTSGGIAVARDFWLGGNNYMKSQFAALVVGDWEGSGGNPSINFLSENTGSAGTPNAKIQVYGGSGSVNSGTLECNAGAYVFGSTGTVSVNNTTASSSVSTGAMVLAGGIGINNTTEATSRTNGGTLTSGGGMGIAKRLFVGGNIYSFGTSTGTNDVAQLILGPAPSATNFDYCSQIRSVSNSGSNFGSQLQFYTHGTTTTGSDGTLRMSIDLSGVTNITNTTASTSSTSGSLLLVGGLGINNTTDATSSTNGGTITTAGGMAVAKKLYVGSNLSVTGTITGNVNINSTGSVNRDINVKVGDIITPEDFGAVGDGVTDDSAAFQLALNTQKTVMCRKSIYLVGNLNIFWGTQLIGNGCTFRPTTGSNWVFNAYGWNVTIKDCRFDDPGNRIVKSTTVGVSAIGGATTITLASTTGLSTDMAVSIKLDNRRPHVSWITNISGSDITIRHALPSNASLGNEVYAYFGLIKFGKAGNETLYHNIKNLVFTNTSSAIHMSSSTTCAKLMFDSLNLGDVAYGTLFLKDCGNDCSWSNIVAFSGYIETTNYTGTGATFTYTMTTAALIKTDITVTVNGVTKTVDVDYTYSADGSTLTFVVAPPLGQAVIISHYKPADIGMLIDNGGFTTPYVGNFSNISVLHCWYGVKLYSTGLTMISPVLDGCNVAFYQKDSGTSVGTLIVNALLGFNGDDGIYIDTGVLNTSFTGGLWTIGASASPYKYNGLLGRNVYVETGSTIYIDRDAWNFKDSGDNDSTVVANGTIKYMRNAARAEDGTVSLPTFSFRQDSDTGLYRVGSGDIGVACNGVKIVDISATAMDLTGTNRLRLNVADTVIQIGSYSASNNPAINFYSVNTGGLATVNAKIQAYGGSASNNTGTLEFNGASYVFGSTGTVSVNNTTASSSVSTGAMVLAGGIGINNTTEATSRTNGGTLTSGGGMGIAKRLFVGGNVYSFGTSTGTNDVAQLILGPAPSATNFDYCSQIRSVSSSGSNFGSQLQFYTHGTASTAADGTVRMTIGNAGTVSITSTTASTTNSVGCLVLSGGMASSNTTDATDATNGGTITTAGGAAIAKKLFVAGIASFTSATDSTSSSTGGLLVTGGIGVATVTDATSATNGGSFTTAGGMAVAKKLYVGSDLAVTGTLSKGAGSFVIPHPDNVKREMGYKLKHCFVESNTRGDNIYRYCIDINSTLSYELDLPDYFDLLNENPQVFISPKNNFGCGFGIVEGNKVNVNVNKEGKYNVLVIGTRKDKLAYDFFDGMGGAEFL